MKVHVPDNCGNSPRSLLAIDIAVNLAAGKYAKIEQFLADDFTWSAAGRNDVMTRAELKLQMDRPVQPERSIDRLEILTSISHGKYAAVSGRAQLTNGTVSSSHDLYEFTGAGASAKLRRVTSYIVDSDD